MVGRAALTYGNGRERINDVTYVCPKVNGKLKWALIFRAYLWAGELLLEARTVAQCHKNEVNSEMR